MPDTRQRASVERAWRGGKNSAPPVPSCSPVGRGKFRTCWQQVFPSIVTRLHGLSFTRGRTKFPQHLLRNISNLPARPNFPPLSLPLLLLLFCNGGRIILLARLNSRADYYYHFFFSAWPLFLNIIAILHPLPPLLSLSLLPLFIDHLFFTTVNRRCSTNLDHHKFLLNDIYAPCKFSTATLTDVLEREREFNTFRSRRDLEQFWDETSE